MYSCIYLWFHVIDIEIGPPAVNLWWPTQVFLVKYGIPNDFKSRAEFDCVDEFDLFSTSTSFHHSLHSDNESYFICLMCCSTSDILFSLSYVQFCFSMTVIHFQFCILFRENIFFTSLFYAVGRNRCIVPFVLNTLVLRSCHLLYKKLCFPFSSLWSS